MEKESALAISPEHPAPIIRKNDGATPAAVVQNGPKNVYFETVNNSNIAANSYNTYIINNGMEDMFPSDSELLSDEYYNLVVVGLDTNLPSCGHVLMPKDRSLTEGFNKNDINSRLCHLTALDVEELLTFPALILHENTESRGKTDPRQKAFYGILTDVKVQDNGIRIGYEMRAVVNQTSINALSHELGLQYRSALTELNRTHWVVKKINLREVLYENRLIGKDC